MTNLPTNAPVQGVRYFSANQFSDGRGSLTKTWSSDWDDKTEFPSKEIFYSVSSPGVIRGMHLQIREAASARYVTVITGRITDVILDLRPESPTFLNYQAVEMEALVNCTVFVPAGVAHGFQSLQNSTTLYLSGATHSPLLDSGINADSFGFQWPMENSIRSPRDETLPSLADWLKDHL